MFYLGLGLFALGVVALDQLTKILTVRKIAEGGCVRLLDRVVHLTYVRNDGAAFSMLSGQRWLFIVIALAAIVLATVLIWKKVFTKKTELFCLAAILGGAIGNLIDRVVYGSVVDMIELEFMHFAVFNVADCFITCGVFLLCLYELWLGLHKTEGPDAGGRKA